MTPKITFRGDNGNGFTSINLFSDPAFTVAKIDGLRWGSQEIAESTTPYKDGATVQNVHGLVRDIEIELKPTESAGDYSALFDRFSQFMGKDCNLQWKNKTIEGGNQIHVEINGIMTECEEPLSDDDVRLRIVIHCAEPYWITFARTIRDVTSATIIGTAPPSNVSISVPNCTIPTVAGNNRLSVGGWFFIAPTAAITGDAVFASPATVRVGGTSHLETIINGLNPKDLARTVVVQDLRGENTYRFSITYTPRFY